MRWQRKSVGESDHESYAQCIVGIIMCETPEVFVHMYSSYKAKIPPNILPILIFSVCRRYRRKTRKAKEKLDSKGYDHISLPFLGTKYEIISRKSSQVSELSQQPLSNGPSHHQAAAGLDVFDGRVSRYIDADVRDVSSLTKDRDQSYADDPRNISFQTILDQTLEKAGGQEKKEVEEEEREVNPPRAESEDWSSGHGSGEEEESSNSLSPPALALTPPSPKERPKSDNFEAPPWIPIKVR